jgi:hypothetical protein
MSEWKEDDMTLTDWMVLARPNDACLGHDKAQARQIRTEVKRAILNSEALSDPGGLRSWGREREEKGMYSLDHSEGIVIETKKVFGAMERDDMKYIKGDVTTCLRCLNANYRYDASEKCDRNVLNF